MRENTWVMAGSWRYAELFRYAIGSIVALAVDMALLLLLTKVIHYLAAATVSFLAGVVVIYGLSTRFVFCRRRFAARQAWEGALFLLVGAGGLALNNLTLYLAVDYLVLPLAFAKLLAASLTFLFNFCMRKALLF